LDLLHNNLVPIKVLIIGDELETRDMLKLALEPGSFEVLGVCSGAEGISAARQVKPEVVILDMQEAAAESEQQRIALCREIRSVSRAPILVLSTQSKPEMIAQTLDDGADDYLLKPMPGAVLTAHLKKLARRSHGLRPEGFS
jgi:DNA-binding response OmpR family regulator